MEDRVLYEIMAPETEEKESFKIDNDNAAEWALTVIKTEQEDRDRLIGICEHKIQEYQEKIEQFKKQYENSTSHLISCLNQYFQTVPKKKTKTQETYQLPSGKLKLKYPGPKFEQDKDKLLEWLKDNEMTDYIETKESPKWGELKKITAVQGDDVIIEKNGVIIDGVTAVDRPPVFEVEV